MIKKIFLTFLFLILFFLYLKISIFDVNEIEKNEVYKLKILANKNSLKVLKINNRDLNKAIYLKNKVNLKYGYYDIKYIFSKQKIVEINESRFNKYRNKLIKLIDKNYENKDLKAFINAIIIGNKSFLSKEMDEKFKYLSISHLIVISGLHISILRKFLDENIKLENRVKNILIWIFLTIYSVFVGFSTSIKRVYIMNSLDIFLKDMNYKKSYLLSMLILLVLNIYEIKTPSFIFSYLSVFVIFFVHPIVLRKINNRYIRMFLLPILIQMFLMPFNICFLKRIPLLAFLANILLIPISAKFLNLIMLNLFLNFFEIDIFNFLIEYIYLAYETIIILLFKIKYMSIDI